jgi:pimeloyl-ACP methyl ester carboxylesterase
MAHPMPELAGVDHRFVELSGFRMHVAMAGTGEPVVLLHGWPQHWWAWRRLIPDLARHYCVICPDLRGFGWSDAPPAGYTKDQLATDIVQLLDKLGHQCIRLVGHDWGGYIGFLICLQHPGRVERYLALNTAHPFPLIDARTLAALSRLWFQPLIATPCMGPRLIGGPKQRFVRWLLDSGNVNESVWSLQDTELYLAQLREPSRARASSLLYRTFLTRELLPSLHGRHKRLRLHTPTLFLHGTGDPTLRPALLRGFEPYADDMTLELVDGVGHFITDERPELVANKAREFFTR